jgi:hypothetical protein
VRLAFGSLFIKQRLGLTDEETVERIRENPYMQFSLGFAGYSSMLPFDPSMMVHLHKRLSEEDIKRINELVAERFKAMGIEALSSLQDDDNSGDPGAETGSQLSIDDIVKPADWPEGKSWGTLTIDSKDLIPQAMDCKQEYGCYPERICADRIYNNRKNRNFCTRNNIRLSGKRLGRPPKDPEINAAHKQQLSANQRKPNEMEGCFGFGMRKNSLDLIMARLPKDAET